MMALQLLNKITAIRRENSGYARNEQARVEVVRHSGVNNRTATCALQDIVKCEVIARFRVKVCEKYI